MKIDLSNVLIAVLVAGVAVPTFMYDMNLLSVAVFMCMFAAFITAVVLLAANVYASRPIRLVLYGLAAIIGLKAATMSPDVDLVNAIGSSILLATLLGLADAVCNIVLEKLIGRVERDAARRKRLEKP